MNELYPCSYHQLITDKFKFRYRTMSYQDPFMIKNMGLLAMVGIPLITINDFFKMNENFRPIF